jgi:hypothetical protein
MQGKKRSGHLFPGRTNMRMFEHPWCSLLHFIEKLHLIEQLHACLCPLCSGRARETWPSQHSGAARDSKALTVPRVCYICTRTWSAVLDLCSMYTAWSRRRGRGRLGRPPRARSLAVAGPDEHRVQSCAPTERRRGDGHGVRVVPHLRFRTS